MNGMTASRLRIILSVSILLLIVAVAGGFLFAQRNLKGYATTISRLNADAESGDQNIRTLRSLKTRLAEEQLAITSARSIVADNATYADQVISDITRIANESGVTITSFEFAGDATASGTAPAPGAVPTTPTTTAPTAGGAPAGVTKKAVTVTLQSPLKYTSLMNFIQKVETNKLKMQFASVAMTKGEKDTVTAQTFSIEVYVRS